MTRQWDALPKDVKEARRLYTLKTIEHTGDIVNGACGRPIRLSLIQSVLRPFRNVISGHLRDHDRIIEALITTTNEIGGAAMQPGQIQE